MGYGSAGTPPWVDEEKIDEERKELKNAKNEAILKALQKENVALRKRVKQLEDELQRLKK
jgi:predicted  nucleic acid-binding Zn-ribbon protein